MMLVLTCGACAVYNVLVGVAGISLVGLVALSEGVPLRGGLQVGPAVEIFPQEARDTVRSARSLLQGLSLDLSLVRLCHFTRYPR